MPMRPTDRLRTALLPQFREGGGNHSTGSKFCGRRGVKDTSLHWVLQHQRHNLHLPDRAVLGCHKQARRCEGVANDNIARVEILAPRRVFDFPLDGPSLLQDHEREHSRSLGHGQHIGDTCVQVLPVHSKRRLALPSCLAQRIHGEFRGAECTIFHGLRKPPPRMLHLSSAQLQRRPTKQRLERRVDEVSHRRLQLTVHSCVHQFDDRVEEVPREQQVHVAERGIDVVHRRGDNGGPHRASRQRRHLARHQGIGVPGSQGEHRRHGRGAIAKHHRPQLAPNLGAQIMHALLEQQRVSQKRSADQHHSPNVDQPLRPLGAQQP
mmetsp:Transcript_69289/g.225729  ORF Transcript_69289/g.225729 Transcript_69289/m.225729 type:complete len:322 (-) Transcript_69289:678-1643(-)